MPTPLEYPPDVFKNVSAYLTADVPGTGGVIKAVPDDFVVTEIPAYAPCGQGEHVFITIEKRGLTTLEAIHRIAREFRLPEREIGYAGMKDSDGVTRQTMSLQSIAPEKLRGRELPGIRILSATRHVNKLKLGHLRGNHFMVVIRNVNPDALEHAAAVLACLSLRGVPNRFGYQRYGAQGNSHLVGGAMLRGEWRRAVDLLMGDPGLLRDAGWKAAVEAYHGGDIGEALKLLPNHCRGEREVLRRLSLRPEAWESAFRAVHPRLRKLYLSAWQSFLFDRAVDLRLSGLDRLLPGDLAWKHDNGACFLVEKLREEQIRAERLEISPSGPLFGRKMKFPQGDGARCEMGILEEAGITAEMIEAAGALGLEGGRRPLRVPLEDPLLGKEGEDGLRLEFALPRGSYATSVLREITKTF